MDVSVAGPISDPSPPIPPVIDDMTATTPTTLVTPNSTVSFVFVRVKTIMPPLSLLIYILILIFTGDFVHLYQCRVITTLTYFT